MSKLEADVVIVGAGSAGCVLARRLSENRAVKVLLLEAGSERNSFVSDIPGMTYRLMGNPRSDWCYMAEPDPTIRGRVLGWNGGKMLGGSSSINGLVYIRGLQRDYDDWANAGCNGWSWKDVEPCFRRAENFENRDLASLGSDGPLSVSRIRSLHPLTHAFMNACTQSGIETLADYAIGDREGAFINFTSQRRGQRSSTANSYLAPVENRPNLQLIRGAVADKILFENGRATGLMVYIGGIPTQVAVRSQVILSAGAIQSPAILLRSGIGPAAQLQALGIPMQLVASGVGRNLQDHCGLTISKFVNVPTYNSQMGVLDGMRHLANYVLFRRGALASAAVQAMAWVRSDPGLSEPDVHLNWLPYGIDYTVTPPVMHKRPSTSLGVCVSRPHSRGEIRLRSNSVHDKPIIDHRLLGDERDVAAVVRSCRLMENVFRAPALASAVIGNNQPVQTPDSDRDWEEYAREHCGIGYHAVGTCAMGAGSDSVVDTQLRLRGVGGVRVIDASVMPRLVSANTNAATIMIAEKGAEYAARDLR